MHKFARVSDFDILSEQDSRKLFGGNMPEPTKKTVPCTIITTTANCTCVNNVPDSCTDTGQGSECLPDDDPA